MRDRALLRQALESNKTVSKKAQARLSRTSSAANSPAGSRTVSRNPSDDEQGDLSDSTDWRQVKGRAVSLVAKHTDLTLSTNSIDDLLSAEGPEETIGQWTQELSDRIEEIINRKRSSVQGRELALAKFVHILMTHYAYDETESKTGELIPALMKTIKSGDSDQETSLALKAIGLTLITTPSEDVYDVIFQPVKRVFYDAESPTVKATAIQTLSAAAIYGGAADSEIEEIMVEYLEIIESDGASIGAEDNGAVVKAACEAWGFLATYIDDISEKNEDAMEAFVDQLDSSDVAVKIAAGENIALIYEKSYSPREADDSPDSVVDGMVCRYPAYRNFEQLCDKVTELARDSSKRIAKRDRQLMHANFNDILNTIEHPTQGPRYSNAIDQRTGLEYGSRFTYKLSSTESMTVDNWWKLHRLQALTRFMGSGFKNHFNDNPVVSETLPNCMQFTIPWWN